MDIQEKEWGSFVEHLKTKGIVKIGRNSLGVITNLVREGSCSLNYNDIELIWETWQAAKAQAVQAEFEIGQLKDRITELLDERQDLYAQINAQAVPEWISVEDRMPEQGQKVLVFRPDAHNHPYKDPNFKICTYAGADIFINSHFEHTITHWKPITAPVEVKEPAND